MRLRLGALAPLVVLALAPPALAQPLERGALRLEWSAPGGCPNGVEVVDRIETLLGVRIADLAPEPIVARGTIREVAALRYELTLETHQRDQRFARSMQAPSCDELSDAGALVLALAIDPTLAERQARGSAGTEPGTSALPTESPPAPGAEPKAPPAAAKPRVETLDTSDPRDEPPPPPPPPPPSRPSWSARIGLVLDLGSVSDLSFGARATVGLGFDAFRLELGALWLPPARTYLPSDDQVAFIEGNPPERGGAIDLVVAQADACYLPFRGDFELEGCAGLELGRLHGAGFGTSTEEDGSALWFGVGAGALARGKATSALSIVVSAAAVVVPQRTEFILENVGTVYRVPTLLGRFGLAIETEFE
ncbi:MAG TPA: hypothetical protein VMS65_12390 [Polyangiaceae bacterium]|nr:hypothetical protein [Polyangiaceae bacterium]